MPFCYCLMDYSCNNNCIFCATGPKNQGSVTTDQIKAFISKNLSPKGCDNSVLFTGGEPTIRPDLPELVEFAVKKYNAQASILTNARVFSHDHSLVSKLEKAGLLWATASFYECDPVRHDALTKRPGSFYETSEGIKKLIASGINVEIRSLIHKKTFQRLPQIGSHIIKTFPGANKYSFVTLDLCGLVMDHLPSLYVNYKDMAPYLEQTLDLFTQRSLPVEIINFPHCMIAPEYWRLISFSGTSNFNYLSGLSQRDNVDSNALSFDEKCDTCLLKGLSCQGIYTTYLEHVGADEFTPIQDKITFSKNHLTYIPRDSKTLAVDAKTGAWGIIGRNNVEILNCIDGIKNVRQCIDELPFATAQVVQNMRCLHSANLIFASHAPLHVHYEDQEDAPFPQFISLHMTDACNLRCGYCYASASTGPIISKKVLAVIAEKTMQLPVDNLHYEFHGGEPLLAFEKIRFFVETVTKLAETKRIAVRFSLQTNATLITPEICDFIRKYQFNVGVSIDGPKKLHDSNRTTPDGNGSFEAVMKGIKLLQQKKITFGVLTVVTETNQDQLLEVYRFLKKNHIESMKIMPVDPQGRGANHLSISGNRYANNCLKLAIQILKENQYQPGFRLSNIAHLLESITSSVPSYMCLTSPCGAGRHMLAFDAKGNIYPCEQLTTIPDAVVGNIMDVENLGPMLSNSSLLKEIKQLKVEQKDECRDCTWQVFCGGGCRVSFFLGKEINKTMCDYHKKAIPELMWMLYDTPEASTLLSSGWPQQPP